ncbi:uncharacterized protein LOC134204527 isoform X2 [Armigeres subalbatus]|uniref:uncharacterized protein LOC134204527 isoform X2 n=1 Tax=Armigeres subalbatus TaxID=124917 RepID=UPI002ED5B954
MTKKCVVPGCGANHKTDGAEFFRFATVLASIPVLSAQRSQKWIQALGFRSQYNTNNKVICNKHFVLEPLNAGPVACHCKTNGTRLEMEILRLQKTVDNLRNQLLKERRGLTWLTCDDMCNRYTGISQLSTLERLYRFVEPALFVPVNSQLSKDELFVLTLRKLRRNTPFSELADEYSICPNTASKFFHRTIFILFDNLKWSVSILPKSVALRHNPLIFQRYFGRRRIFVIDCFEVSSETPIQTRAAIAHHSSYKSRHTTKFLIAMNSNGSVAFISQAYGGRCSDRFIAKDCGFLDILEQDDVVLADKGFDIKDMIASKGAILNIPTFLRKDVQMNPLNMEQDKQITCLRAHVERLIGVLKSKYTYLKGPITVNALRRAENNQNSIDIIVQLTCALINFNPSIIKF